MVSGSNGSKKMKKCENFKNRLLPTGNDSYRIVIISLKKEGITENISYEPVDDESIIQDYWVKRKWSRAVIG